MAEAIILMIAVSTLNIVCFFIGIKAGKNGDINVPDISKINPARVYEEHREKKEAEKKMKEMENIKSSKSTSAKEEAVTLQQRLDVILLNIWLKI